MIEPSPLSRRERATAFHEAGHAAVSLYLDRAVMSVDVASPEDWRHRQLAEARVTGRRNNVGASYDDAAALDYLTALSHEIKEAGAWASCGRASRRRRG